jgi:hypothetical protein
VGPRRFTAGLTVAGVALVVVTSPACGSPQCTDTLTCNDQADLGVDGAPDDASAFDQAVGDVGDAPLADRVVGDVSLPDASTDSVAVGDATKPPLDAACDASAVENCTNGIDDNCNGMVDCADPTCKSAGFTCVPTAPTGWTGPVAYDEGAPPSAACPAGYPTDALDGQSDPSTTAATCSCSCGAVQGASCSLTNVAYYSTLDCTGATCGDDGLPGGQCVAVPCGSSAAASPPVVAGGACTATPSQTVPPVQWQQAQRACTGVVGGGCSAGNVCAPPVASPFAPTPCVYTAGSTGCPSGYPNAATTTYASATDTRSCSACSCGSPTGLSCSVPTMSLWSDVSCSVSQVTSFPANGACVSLGGSGMQRVGGAEASAFGVQGNGSCTASGGTPQGSVTPTQPTTVCCL